MIAGEDIKKCFKQIIDHFLNTELGAYKNEGEQMIRFSLISKVFVASLLSMAEGDIEKWEDILCHIPFMSAQVSAMLKKASLQTLDEIEAEVKAIVESKCKQ